MARLSIHTELTKAANLFRLGREAEGNVALTLVIERLQAELAATDAAAMAPLFPTLEAIVSAQERGDWLFVADLLQYELGKMLVES